MSNLKLRAKRELLWRRFREDPVLYWRMCHYIEHPQGSRKFELREPQRQATELFLTGRNVLTLKARQIGWSTLVAGYALWLAFFHAEKRILFISRGEREARELLKKVQFAIDRMPPWLRDKGPRQTDQNQERVTFSNGSQIVSLPSASNPGRGFTGALVVVDEWAFLPNAEDAWAAIQPVADIGGQIIGLSTANGVGNWFHDTWERSVIGETSFETLFFGWDAVPNRDDEWYERTKRDYANTPHLFYQEYPSNPEEAFIKSGNAVFDVEMLRTFHQPQLVEPAARGHLRKSLDLEFVPAANGSLRIWKFPIDGHLYTIGADVAEGLAHGDYSSAHVVDAGTREVVAVWHGHIPADQFGEELDLLGKFYNVALVCPEINNHGLTVSTVMRRIGYPTIYRRRELNSANKRIGVEYGWKTTRITKPLMVDELHEALREDLILYDEETFRELLTFTRDDHGRMNGSPFDDRVISLALAVQMLKFVYLPEYKKSVDKTDTFEWWMGKINPDREAMVIGANNIRSKT